MPQGDEKIINHTEAFGFGRPGVEGRERGPYLTILLLTILLDQ